MTIDAMGNKGEIVCENGVCRLVIPEKNNYPNLSGRTLVTLAGAALVVYMLSTLVKGAVGQEFWTKDECVTDHNDKEHCWRVLCHYEEICRDLFLGWVQCTQEPICIPEK